MNLNQIADGAAVQHFLGLLEALVMTAHEADALIMKAREHWFEDEKV